MTRDQYVEILKSTAVKMGHKLVMDWLVAQMSWMAWTVPNTIFGFIVSQVLKIAIRETEFGAFFLFIDLRTSAQGRAFEASAIRNHSAQQNGTAEEKAHAEAQLISDFRAFVKFTN